MVFGSELLPPSFLVHFEVSQFLDVVCVFCFCFALFVFSYGEDYFTSRVWAVSKLFLL